MAPKLEATLRYLPAHMHGAAPLRNGVPDGTSEATLARCTAHLQAVLQDISSYLPMHVVRERLEAARQTGPAGTSGQLPMAR